jgi:hypothetical protein
MGVGGIRVDVGGTGVDVGVGNATPHPVIRASSNASPANVKYLRSIRDIDRLLTDELTNERV